MVVSGFFVDIVSETGVEYVLGALLDKAFDMTVHKFCGVACGVGGNRELSFFVCRFGGYFGKYYFVSQLIKDTVPERQKLIHAERHRKTYRGAVFLLRIA